MIVFVSARKSSGVGEHSVAGIKNLHENQVIDFTTRVSKDRQKSLDSRFGNPTMHLVMCFFYIIGGLNKMTSSSLESTIVLKG